MRLCGIVFLVFSVAAPVASAVHLLELQGKRSQRKRGLLARWAQPLTAFDAKHEAHLNNSDIAIQDAELVGTARLGTANEKQLEISKFVKKRAFHLEGIIGWVIFSEPVFVFIGLMLYFSCWRGKGKKKKSGVDEDELPLFPTKYVDGFSVLPLGILNIFFVFGQTIHERERFVIDYGFETASYWEHIQSSGYLMFLFAVYTLDFLITWSVVIYHVTTAHHPKISASHLNKVSIICHMIGGGTAITGLYVTILTGNKIVLLVSILAGLCLHVPSIWWQQRNVHGRREVIIPAYTFMAFTLMVNWANIVLEDASFESVVATGMCLHVFAWCRGFGKLHAFTNMGGHSLHDRAIIFAGLSRAPFFYSAWGPWFFCLFLFWWNFLFNLLQPFPRSLLNINRGYSDVFPKGFQSKSGETFSQMLEEVSKHYSDREESIAVACYKMIGGDETVGVKLRDLEYLFETWGLPQHKKTARTLFERADTDKSGDINLPEFYQHLQFIFKSICDKGEYESDDEEMVMPRTPELVTRAIEGTNKGYEALKEIATGSMHRLSLVFSSPKNDPSSGSCNQDVDEDSDYAVRRTHSMP